MKTSEFQNRAKQVIGEVLNSSGISGDFCQKGNQESMLFLESAPIGLKIWIYLDQLEFHLQGRYIDYELVDFSGDESRLIERFSVELRDRLANGPKDSDPVFEPPLFSMKKRDT